jgi:hypothetical protein
MAGEIQVNSVTALTESGSNIVLNNVDTATNRTNLGLGSMATQNADAVALTGGSLTGTEIDLKSSGTTIYKSDGTTAVLSESGGVVTLGSVTLGGTVTNDTNVIGFRKRLPSDVTSSGIMTYSATGAYINGMTESAGTITIQKAGRYFAYVSLYISHSSTANDYISVQVRVNATNEIGSGANNFGSTVAKRETMNIGGLINLAVDDTVDVYLNISGSGTVFNGIGSEFHLFYLGQ